MTKYKYKNIYREDEQEEGREENLIKQRVFLIISILIYLNIQSNLFSEYMIRVGCTHITCN
jgi:hypothetical protein